MHPRLSVHGMCFFGDTLETLDGHWQRLGVQRLSLLAQDFDGGGTEAMHALIARRGYTIEAITHVFAVGALPGDPAAIAACREALSRTIAAARQVGARTIYMITGGRGDRTWREAGELFTDALAPCAQEAQQAGVALAIENASNLYVDIHLAHTLHDTITLAEMAGVGICLDHFHAWTEAGFPDLVGRALPLIRLVQLSDYVLGDRALPARAVPGDGAIPIASFVEQLLKGGYAHGFDLELLGPRIEAEGRFAAVARAGKTVSALLDRLGA